MIPLFATAMATRVIPEKHPHIHASHYRLLDDLTVSSIGFGTRLGACDDRTDAAIAAALAAYMREGGNFIDAAIVDRCERSERVVGATLGRELSTGRIARREMVVATKGGFLPLDRPQVADRAGEIRRRFIDTGIAPADEVVAMMHCMSPSFLKDQIERSRENLKLEAIDLYYLHNPEAQAPYIARDELMKRIGAAIGALESAASDGVIRRYGISTWSAFRVAPGESDHLELAELVSMAEAVAGSRHHFRAVQVPYSAAMPGAAFSATQRVYGRDVSILEAAHELGIDVTVSSPLMGGSLATELPSAFHRAFPRFSTDAQRAIDFVVCTPWVASVMVGMAQVAHVEENCRIMREPALDSLRWAAEVDQLA